MFDAEHTATLLIAARRARRLLPLLDTPPPSLQDGIATQLAIARRQGAVPPAGFKIGATTIGMQAYLGLPGPAAGFMAEANVHGSGSTLAYSAFVNPGVECELAVHLSAALPPGPCTPQQAAAAVDGVMAAIEVVENRYPGMFPLELPGMFPLERPGMPASEPSGGKAFGTPAIVADCVFHAAAVLGTPDAGWRNLDLEALPGRILVDGVERGAGTGADLLGGPMQALAWLAASAEAAAFGGLQAGQVVMLGSVALPVWLDGPGRIEVLFPPLAPVVLDLV